MPVLYRKLIRLEDYDYSQHGYYFVTICINQRQCILGHIEEELMYLSQIGFIVKEHWQRIPIYDPAIKIDTFMIMPNHLHGIIIIDREDFVVNHNTKTLGHIIRLFKAKTTHRIRSEFMPKFSWQPNYYEHVIRNEKNLNKIRAYIKNNPLKWSLDRENPLYKKQEKPMR